MAFKARFYYGIQNYQKSYELAQKAYELDYKNKMAHSVLLRSKVALKYEDYLIQGRQYLNQIEKMSLAGVGKVEIKRIEMICDIMLLHYSQLGEKSLITKELELASEQMAQDFKRIAKELKQGGD